jgi:hypothetical protein
VSQTALTNRDSTFDSHLTARWLHPYKRAEDWEHPGWEVKEADRTASPVPGLADGWHSERHNKLPKEDGSGAGAG